MTDVKSLSNTKLCVFKRKIKKPTILNFVFIFYTDTPPLKKKELIPNTKGVKKYETNPVKLSLSLYLQQP